MTGKQVFALIFTILLLFIIIALTGCDDYPKFPIHYGEWGV